VIRSLVIAGGACALLASVAGAAPTRTSPLTIAPNDVVFVVNPDSNTVARLDFSGIAGALTQEAGVGTYPRTVTVAPGIAAPDGSVTTPRKARSSACRHTTSARSRQSRFMGSSFQASAPLRSRLGNGHASREGAVA